MRVADNKKGYRCNGCGEHFTAKSNQAIYEELLRITKYLKPKSICCSNPDCLNHTVPVGTKKAYRSFGKTAQGAKRYRCNECLKTVSVPLPTQWQHDTHQNETIFKMLVNKVPLSRIVHMTGINWATLYRRIDFIHKQCLDFAAQQETELKNIAFDRLYLSVDQQNYFVNWTERLDKRNITLSAITTADNHSGYVFASNPNFDMDTDRIKTQNEANLIHDADLDPAFRKFARVWLKADYEYSLNTAAKKALKKLASNTVPAPLSTSDLEGVIMAKYDEAVDKEDCEAKDLASLTQLPSYGVQVKGEYTMFGHFLAVKSLFGEVGKYRFFLDQDSGIRGAFMNAYKDEVKTKSADAFYVSIEKEITVDEKRKIKNDANRLIAHFLNANPQFDENQAKLELLKQSIVSTQSIGKWGDKWVNHPIPSMSEAKKKMCWLTEDHTMSLDHKAWLFNKASLHSVDNFFQKVRRRISLLERPIKSSANAGRMWNGYGAYDPSIVVKALDIFRVVHNFIDTKEEKHDTGIKDNKGKAVYNRIESTPAMRIGLAGKPMTYEEILYFNQ